jgi:hypothetical protein
MGISGASATSAASMDAELDISALSANSMLRVHAFFTQSHPVNFQQTRLCHARVAGYCLSNE